MSITNLVNILIVDVVVDVVVVVVDVVVVNESISYGNFPVIFLFL
jgi:hypothetical protein